MSVDANSKWTCKLHLESAWNLPSFLIALITFTSDFKPLFPFKIGEHISKPQLESGLTIHLLLLIVVCQLVTSTFSFKTALTVSAACLIPSGSLKSSFLLKPSKLFNSISIPKRWLIIVINPIQNQVFLHHPQK